MTDLAGTQLTSLLEALPGIAHVLRSPVADAFINVIKAATGQAPFNLADAEEIMRYSVRRNLLTADESERVLAEARNGMVQQAAAARANAKLVKAAARAAAKPNGKKALPARKAVKSAPKPAKPANRKHAKPAPKKAVHKK